MKEISRDQKTKGKGRGKEALALEHVSFRYEDQDTYVLKDAELSVSYGEVALLCGYSGEGKSTVLSLLAGIIPNVTPGEVTGDVRVGGKSVLGEKMSEICRRVGVVLQNADAQIIQQLVEDEVAFGCENFAFSREEMETKVRQACETWKLDAAAKTRTLSGGQKQRLITASTFATGQKILILDEPLANLDREGADFLMEALKRLVKEGYAVLVVEHRLDMVLSYVDKVFSIAGGVISEIRNHEEYLASQAQLISDETDAQGKVHAEEAAFPGESNADVPPSRQDREKSDREPVFIVSHVGMTIGKHGILKDVDFQIQKGERVLLLGENGCGKTTLLRMLARLSEPTSGQVLQNVQGSRWKAKKPDKEWFKKVGIVYQNPNYQLFMPTVFQEIAFGAPEEAYAEEIMERFGITHLRNRHPHSLSEGQKRRVSIAAVAAARPQVLLLDEPTVGQDYAGLKELVRILNRMHEETGNTMITITHDKRCAEALCDHAVWVENGVVKREGGKELAREYFSGGFSGGARRPG